jgi:DNA-binding GntR family transcriptional regulator
LEGRFAPGERLKEEELTDLCGVSRTPVREGLRRLAIEGLVVVTPHQGAQVAAIGDGELEEIYALRAMIEGHAAGRAALLIAEQDIAKLKALASEMEAAVRDANRHEVGAAELNARFTPANSEFHRIILDAAMSPRLAAMASLVVEIPLILRTLARYSEEELMRSLQHHRELIAAFEARDEDWARSVMRSHVLAASHAVVRPGVGRVQPD